MKDTFLITNGCSFVEGHNCIENPKVDLGNIISQKLNCDYTNLARGGNSNDAIFRTTFNYLESKSFNNIKTKYNNIYLIIGLTAWARFDMYIKEVDNYISINAGGVNGMLTHDLDLNLNLINNEIVHLHKMYGVDFKNTNLTQFLIQYLTIFGEYEPNKHRILRELELLNSYCKLNNINLVVFNSLEGLKPYDLPSNLNFYKDDHKTWFARIEKTNMGYNDHPNGMATEIMANHLINYMSEIQIL